jgi:hypothetical protein
MQNSTNGAVIIPANTCQGLCSRKIPQTVKPKSVMYDLMENMLLQEPKVQKKIILKMYD